MAGSGTPHGKILPRDALVAARERARAEGRTVVQCHGCFDIVHPGHVRHLQHARRQGDVLLVSITDDANVNKGDGRPLFPQDLRAENLAALDCVDWVHINPEPTAVGLLEAVRPDVYIKGREYEQNNDPRFAEERRAVEAGGGRILFSSGDVVFSSTALVHAMASEHDPFHARLNQLLDAGEVSPGAIDVLLSRAGGKRIAVLGETILDTYIHCEYPEIAGESPVPSLRPLDQTHYDGGAAIIALHLAAMGAKPVLVTALPRSTEAQALRQRLEGLGVEVRAVECDGPLLEKQRFLVGTQKLMKLDNVRPIALDASRHNELFLMAAGMARELDGAILADFGCGFFTQGVTNELIRILRPVVGTLAGDTSGRRSSLARMKGLDLVCPTESELRSAVNEHDNSLNAAVWSFMRQTGSHVCLVTLAHEGVIAFRRLDVQGPETPDAWRTRVAGEHIPALTQHPVDPLGCGDALLAGATLATVAGAGPTVAAYLGSVAAAHHATRMGNEAVTAADLRTGVQRLAQSRLAITPSRIGARLVS
jgi:rfaE bifunctional protein nucleotidyltransferase chain/domain